jgi:hypothetical protein
MALEETIDTLEGVDEKYQDLYVENSDGKFEINIGGLKSALTKERTLKKALEKKVANLDKSGDEPDIEALKNELMGAKDTINNMTIKGKVKSEAIKAGIDPEYVDDVITLTKSNFKLDETGDIVCVDKNGEATGKNVGAFFRSDFKKNKPRYFVSSGRQGSGSHNSDIVPTTLDGKINKAIKENNFVELVKLKQSKINNLK